MTECCGKAKLFLTGELSWVDNIRFFMYHGFDMEKLQASETDILLVLFTLYISGYNMSMLVSKC